MENIQIEMPAIRGIQAGRPYYLVTMPMSYIKRLICFDNAPNVLDRSQRDINSTRVKKISQYMQDNLESYVLPSLTGVINGEPEFVAANEQMPNVGILKFDFDMDVNLFDGQHRASGIIDAVQKLVELRADQVGVQLYQCMSLEERQTAFSDVNLNTVKPSTSISTTYDHRNPVSQFVVNMTRDHLAFNDYVDYERSVISGNSTYLFTVKNIKDATMKLINYKTGDALDKETQDLVSNFWSICDEALGWEDTRMNGTANQLRDEKICTHGVFINALGIAGNLVYNQYRSHDALKMMNTLDVSRYSEQFNNRCLCPATGKMIANVTAAKLTAIEILRHVGCPVPSELQALERQYFPDATFPEVKPTKADEPEFKHPLKATITKVFPDINENTLSCLCEDFEKIAIEWGEKVNGRNFKSMVRVTLGEWKSPQRKTIRHIRTSFNKQSEQAA